MSAPFSFSIPISRDELERRRAQLVQSGIPLGGDTGTIDYSGITLAFTYMESTSALVITIVHKTGLARFVADETIEEKVRNLLLAGPT